MYKPILFLSILCFLQSCKKENTIVTDRFDYQYLYQRWEQSDFDNKTGSDIFRSYDGNAHSFEFLENGTVIYRNDYIKWCGTQSPGTDSCDCQNTTVEEFEAVGKFSLDGELKTIKIDIPEISLFTNWEIVALNEKLLQIISR